MDDDGWAVSREPFVPLTGLETSSSLTGSGIVTVSGRTKRKLRTPVENGSTRRLKKAGRKR
jgi:hypothetical protein